MPEGVHKTEALGEKEIKDWEERNVEKEEGHRTLWGDYFTSLPMITGPSGISGSGCFS